MASSAGSSCVDIAPDLLHRREGSLLGSLCLVVDELLGVHSDHALRLRRERALLGQLGAEKLDRVALLPARELPFRAVLGGIRSRVAAVAVGLHLEQRRPLTGASTLDR